MSFSKRLHNFLHKEVTGNRIVLLAVLSNFIVFLTAFILKFTLSADYADASVDILKLYLVSSNIFLLGFLLYQKKVLGYGTLVMKVIFYTGLILCTLGALFNVIVVLSSIILHDKKDDSEFLPFNNDFFTLGITLTTDILYCTLYMIFQAKRSICTSMILILIELVIFSACSRIGTDSAIDSANMIVSLITCMLSVILWSSKVILNTSGAPLEFKDYFERDDLDGIEILVSGDIPDNTRITSSNKYVPVDRITHR